jgi:hypothetical protein
MIVLCEKCGLQMQPAKSGVVVAEMRTDGPNVESVYRLWIADALECKGCGARVIAGFPKMPLVESFDKNFAKILVKYPPAIRWHEWNWKRK